MKKVMMSAGILCICLLLGMGCGMKEIEEKDIMTSSSEEDMVEKVSPFPREAREEILNELTEFCNEHKEKLNEMSEYYINAVEDVSDYKDDEKLPDIGELSSMFTDEEGSEILKKLLPYYPSESNYGYKFKQVYYPYEQTPVELYMVAYIGADGEELEAFMDDMSTNWIEVREIDKHLFVIWEYTPIE